ncbi:16S rRNA (guanine(527)-N(7))-methyltransferase RsmG [Neptunomonas qingdaonensis]|uniref:Ribosomal RNA small subunit methyltransferase G n=1 Tax=Neptunomonas qingdaonensis TaxID=1045558 RepID=A0A1I2LG88_9GAMM|nr:16S rRNA (guanine(527)-N(7))-methyltransferase RsmG [Neptunomonas qingdaonensis]SFF78422.1 16S rRNA (guanine527-N7)-methyltransferase [Neptunomonas qingdaonensis]
MDVTQQRALLVKQSDKMALALTDNQLDTLMAYLQLLVKWNKAYNLTAVKDPVEMVSRHLLDSLSLLPFIKGPRIIDVGSGAGLPGIPLAICRPDIDVTTLDSNGKKTRFQNQVKVELGLSNLTVINGRAEACVDEPFDQVVSRAFASIADMINWTHQLCRQEGVFLAMKGLYPEDELTQLPAGFVLKNSHSLNVPGTQGARHLMVIGRG